MKVMGVRELKARLSEALIAVEAGEIIEVTDHGRSVVLIVPVDRRPDPEEIAAALESVTRLAEEIGQYVPHGVTAEQVINDIRS